MGTGRPSDLVLFIDVDFWEHPKVRSLSPAERDGWLHLMAEQLRSGDGAYLRGHAFGVSRKRLGRYLEAGLLDEEEGAFHIHNWDRWNGREAYKRFLARERKRRQRRRDSDSLAQ